MTHSSTSSSEIAKSVAISENFIATPSPLFFPAQCLQSSMYYFFCTTRASSIFYCCMSALWEASYFLKPAMSFVTSKSMKAKSSLFEVWISEFAFWSFYISRLIFSKKLRKRLWFYISKLKVLMVFRTYWIWPWIFVLSILFSNSVLVNSYCLYISWLLCIIFSSFGPAYLSIFEISGRPNYSLFR